MKDLILPIIALLLYACANGNKETTKTSAHFEITQQNSKNPRVLITYNQLINGYKVNVIWFPFNGTSEVGSAFIEVTHQSGTPKFIIASSHYTTLDTRNLADSIKAFTDGQVFLLDYNAPREERQFDGITPFFFRDVDFDGKDEFLITEWQGGANGSNRYDAYKIYEHYAEKLTSKPFDNITDTDVYDYEGQTITTWSANGADYSIKKVYGYYKTEYNAMHFEHEILDNYYTPIQLDSVIIHNGKNITLYVRQNDKLVLLDAYTSSE